MNKNSSQKVIIDITTKTIVKIFTVALILFFLYMIREVIAILLVSIIIVAAMSPLVERLKKIKIPRSVTVLCVYIIFFGTIGLLASLIIPQVAFQIREVSKDVPQFIERFNDVFGKMPQHEEIAEGVQAGLKDISENLAASPTNSISAIFRIFGGIITFFVILILVFYLSVAEGEIKEFFKSMVPKNYEKKFHKIGEKVQSKIGAWVRGEAILMFAVFFITFIGLWILGVKYALTLAVIAGILEIVPVIGPIISSIPAIIIAFTQSPFLGLLVLILYIVIQQSENHIIVPKVMQKTTGLSPVVIVISFLIGAKLLGILGMLLAVPIAVILSVFVDEFISKTIDEDTGE